VGIHAEEEPMKLAYADPPYIGYSKYYKGDPLCNEVDHNSLMQMMCDKYDSWALSLYTNSLPVILKMPSCPTNNIRIGVWIKPWSAWHKNINPTYQWEPVIFYNIRNRSLEEVAVKDWISANATTMTGLIGAKPLKFCFWLFDMLGAKQDDLFTDLYPGTGIVSRAWDIYTRKKSVQILGLPLFDL
jgi:hypothetical protein